jgi:hypothetical protein
MADNEAAKMFHREATLLRWKLTHYQEAASLIDAPS